MTGHGKPGWEEIRLEGQGQVLNLTVDKMKFQLQVDVSEMLIPANTHSSDIAPVLHPCMYILGSVCGVRHATEYICAEQITPFAILYTVITI